MNELLSPLSMLFMAFSGAAATILIELLVWWFINRRGAPMRHKKPTREAFTQEREMLESYRDTQREMRDEYGVHIRVTELLDETGNPLLMVAVDNTSLEEWRTAFPLASTPREDPPENQIVAWPSLHYSSFGAAVYGAAFTLYINWSAWVEQEFARPPLETTEE